MQQSPPRKKRRHRRSGDLPKGAYRLPTGGYVTKSQGRASHRSRTISVMAVHRDEPDADKVAKALIEIVLENLRNQKHD